MKCKSLAATMMVAGFFMGMTLSGHVNDLRKHFHYEAAKGFYERPYDLQVKTKKNLEGEIESYLYDSQTKNYYKIGKNMYVGSNWHRMKTAASIPKEIVENHQTLLSFYTLYSFIFNNI